MHAPYIVYRYRHSSYVTREIEHPFSKMRPSNDDEDMEKKLG